MQIDEEVKQRARWHGSPGGMGRRSALPPRPHQIARDRSADHCYSERSVVPAKPRGRKSIERRPELNLYAADKRHPSMAGTYLAAATLYAALLKRSPVGLKYGAGLDDATAKHLQTVAWDTVRDYFGTAVSSK